MPDDNSEVEPLLPIPNRTVKRFSADDSGHTPVKVGHRQASQKPEGHLERGGLLHRSGGCSPFPLAESRIERSTDGRGKPSRLWGVERPRGEVGASATGGGSQPRPVANESSERKRP